MPWSMMKKIPGAVAKPTKMSLSLADRSIVHPVGILHDVLVKVAGFVFPADFVVLDMEEDGNWEPLLLGRPFLATGRTLIDVESGELVLRTEDQNISINVFEAMKRHDEDPKVENWYEVGVSNNKKKEEKNKEEKAYKGEVEKRVENESSAKKGKKPL
ncbi:hypothetical protein L195_g059286, partial [Trifolium pratense]